MPRSNLDNWVGTENIARFQKHLETATDPRQVKLLHRLLAEEQAKMPKDLRF